MKPEVGVVWGLGEVSTQGMGIVQRKLMLYWGHFLEELETMN